MNKLILLLAMSAYLSSTSGAPGEFSQRYSDFAMDQRLCVSMITGFEFISFQFSEVMQAYVNFYNHPLSFED